MIHEYHATMAMQEHHRRVGEVTRRAHLHPHVRRPSWWTRTFRRASETAPTPVVRPALVSLPGVPFRAEAVRRDRARAS
jgi:hypothetical protein